MRIDAKTKIFGIIGYPLGHTFSPEMHNNAFRALGINAIYLVFPMRNLIGLKNAMRKFSICGLSVTIPFKEKIRRIVDHIDPLAMEIGAINTIVWKRNLLEGYNTDGIGAREALKEKGISLQGKRILILGSGGSARAISFTLLRDKPEEIAFVVRSPLKARKLIRSLKVYRKKDRPYLRYYTFSQLLPEVVHSYDILIQTTPIGMRGHEEEGKSPLEENFLHSSHVVFDIVYNPLDTPLLKKARKKGAEIIYGYKMLLYQGAKQFELFTKEEAPIEVMEKALKEALGVK